MFFRIIKYFFAVLGFIILYEIIRAIIKIKVKTRLQRSVKEFLEKHQIQLNKYKFMNKIVVKQELLNDREINKEIIKHAQEKGLKIQDVRNQVEEYIEEIVPFFNLLSYYKVGYGIAKFLLNLIYEVVIDQENAEKLKKIPSDSVVIYVMNHRSNIDYILVAYMLAQEIALSYAVGEWARVWPLEYIFKSFGAYFIRRKFRDKLYHLVLEKYVQLISLQGVTQGIFIEGGLSRDGNFRDTKIGLLDYIIKIKKNPDFKKELVFVPVSINYDWVLEDRNLIQEWKKGKKTTSFKDNLSSLIRIVIKGPLLLIINFFRYLTGKLKQHGYASVSFGDPVFLSEFFKEQKEDIFQLEHYDRLSKVKIFADSLLSQIGAVLPVTPICLTAKVLTSFNNNSITKSELIKRIGEMRKALKRENRRIVLGKAFERSQKSFMQLESEKEDRRQELVAFEEEFLEADEAQQTAELSLEIMKRRKIVKIRGDKVLINQEKKSFLEYYSNSLNHLLIE